MDIESRIKKLALQLKDQMEEVDLNRQQRDLLVREAHNSGVTKYRLSKWCGLSPLAITKIIKKG